MRYGGGVNGYANKSPKRPLHWSVCLQIAHQA